MFFSCESRNSSKVLIHEVPDSGSLISREINLTDAPLIPSKIVTFPDKAVVFDHGGKKNIFKVYSLPDLSFLYAFGEIGEGPEEFRFVDENSLKAHGENLVVLSGSQLIKINLHQEDAVWGDKFDLITANSSPINRLLLVNDSIYISDIFDAQPGAPEHQMVHLGRKEIVAYPGGRCRSKRTGFFHMHPCFGLRCGGSYTSIRAQKG